MEPKKTTTPWLGSHLNKIFRENPTHDFGKTDELGMKIIPRLKITTTYLLNLDKPEILAMFFLVLDSLPKLLTKVTYLERWLLILTYRQMNLSEF